MRLANVLIFMDEGCWKIWQIYEKRIPDFVEDLIIRISHFLSYFLAKFFNLYTDLMKNGPR